MADVKFTPGPWVIGQDQTYETALIALSSGGVVAFAAWDGGSGCHLEIKNEADANLIAASPDLYDVLAVLCSVADSTSWAVNTSAMDEAIVAGLAALAKARGES